MCSAKLSPRKAQSCTDQRGGWGRPLTARVLDGGTNCASMIAMIDLIDSLSKSP